MQNHPDPLSSCTGCAVCQPDTIPAAAVLEASDRVTLQAAASILDARRAYWESAMRGALSAEHRARASGRAWTATTASNLISTLLLAEEVAIPVLAPVRLSELAESERVDGPPAAATLRRENAALSAEVTRLRSALDAATAALSCNPRPEA